MSGQLGDLVISLSADIARFREDMGKAVKINNDAVRQIHTDLSTALGSVEGTLGKIGTGFGVITAALAGGSMLKSFVSTTKEVAGEVTALSRAFGISAEQASVLRIAADDAFLSIETITSAGARLTKQLATNEEAFHNLGVETRNSSGNFRATSDIMADVNSKLLQFREGTDRNVEGVKIYGKGWEEARQTLKLTSEAMVEAKERADRLHLVFGEDGLKAVKDYKLAMKDLDDVAESFKVTIGRELITTLTTLASAFGEAGASAADGFGDGIKTALRAVAEAKLNIQDFMARGAIVGQGGPIAAVKAWITSAGRSEIKAELEAQEAMYKYSMEKIAERFGSPVKARKPDKGGLNSEGADTSKEETAYLNQARSAREAFRGYLKADAEAKTALVKSAASEEIEINKQAYEWGLVDLQTYLDKKHKLNQNALKAEIEAKQKELAEARKSEKEALAAYDNDPTGDTAKTVNEAYAKVAQATKAVTEAQEKLTLAKLTDAEETKKMTAEQLASFASTRVALLELAGDYETAETLKQESFRKTNEYMKLQAAALSGNKEAWQAIMDLEQKEAVAMIQALTRKDELARKYTDDLANMQDGIDKWLGKSSELIDAEKKMRDGVATEVDLQTRLNQARTAGNAADIAYYSKKLEMQSIVNQRLQNELSLLERQRVLLGEIVGFNNGVAIERDAYQRQMAATGYISDSSLVNNTSNTQSSSLNVNIGNINVAGGSNANSTGQTIAAEIRNGVQSYQFQMLSPMNLNA